MRRPDIRFYGLTPRTTQRYSTFSMSRIAALALVLACTSTASSGSDTSAWAKRIISKEHRPILSFVNPHVDAVKVLMVDGKKFEGVRGVSKFYIPVPQIDSILFVVDEKDYSVTYHIL